MICINYVKYFSVLVFFLFIFSAVSALPGIPNRFFGTVNVNSVPASDGVNVVAKVSGVEVASTTTSNGTYGYAPNTFDVIDSLNNMKGKTIEFFVSGVKAGESVFVNGAITELNFSVEVVIPVSCGDGTCNGDESCSSCPTDCGSCAPAGDPGVGGGSGGGDGGGGSLNIAVSEKCINKDIEVTVKLSNGKPASNTSVKVLMDNLARTELLSGTTDDDGVYVFKLSELGDYKLEVRKTGYPTNRLAFSLADCTVLEEPAEELPDELIEDTGPANAPSDVDLGITEEKDGASDDSKNNTNTNPPSTPTGFFGLGELGGNIAVIVLVLVIAGIAFFFWKNKKEE